MNAFYIVYNVLLLSHYKCKTKCFKNKTKSKQNVLKLKINDI